MLTMLTKPCASLGFMLVGAALLSALPAGTALAADWPQWQGPTRDGKTRERITRWPPRELWRMQAGVGYASPVVAGGHVYVVGHEKSDEAGKGRGTDTVYCLDAGTGEVSWRHAYECQTERRDSTAGYPGPRATPAVDSGNLYTLSLEGHLLCLDAQKGDVVWSRNLARDMGGKIPFYGYCGSPLVHGDKVIVEANIPDGGSYVAFDSKTGEVVWKVGNESASSASPALASFGEDAEGTAVLFISGKVLAAHDVSDGRQLWRVDLGWDTWMGPVTSGDLVFASSASLSRGCAVFRFGEREPVWKARRKYQALHCNTVILDGYVYGSDNTRTDYQYQDHNRSRLKCIELATGEVKWTLKGLGWANVIVAGDLPGQAVPGRLLILRESGELVLMEVSPSGYKELGRAQVIEGPCWTVPALAEGRVYCRSNRGEVVCLDVRESRTLRSRDSFRRESLAAQGSSTTLKP